MVEGSIFPPIFIFNFPRVVYTFPPVFYGYAVYGSSCYYFYFLTISLQHRRFISSLCMLYKIFHNPSHPLHSELPNLFHPRRVTRGSLSINSLSFSPMRFHTSQYSRCFIPATTKLWNELPSMIVEATELQKFKIGANAFLLGVDGL